MRYKPGEKEKARERRLGPVTDSFRAYGYGGVGVDGLAKAAGVTSGAIYSQFGSKAAAFDAALAAGLDEVIEAIPKYRREHGAGWPTAFAEYYLGKAHRDDRAGGCAMTALTPEAARAAETTREIFEAKITVIVDLIADGLADGAKAERRGRAWAFLAQLVGGLTFARAMASDDLEEQAAAAARVAAIAAAGPARRGS